MAENSGKIKLRRDIESKWTTPTTPGTNTLFTGQLGLVYRPDGSSKYNTRTPRLITGAATQAGADSSSAIAYAPTSKAGTPYLTPDPDIYTDAAMANDGSDRLIAKNTPVGDNGGMTIGNGGAGEGAVVRNVVVTATSTSLTASDYQAGTVWLLYES